MKIKSIFVFTLLLAIASVPAIADDQVADAVVDQHRGVGTSLFNLEVNPASGLLYVSNQEAFNEIRFDPNLQGLHSGRSVPSHRSCDHRVVGVIPADDLHQGQEVHGVEGMPHHQPLWVGHLGLQVRGPDSRCRARDHCIGSRRPLDGIDTIGFGIF